MSIATVAIPPIAATVNSDTRMTPPWSVRLRTALMTISPMTTLTAMVVIVAIDMVCPSVAVFVVPLFYSSFLRYANYKTSIVESFSARFDSILKF